MSENKLSASKNTLGFPIIRKWVSAKDIADHAEEILDYCDTLNEPLFIERDGEISQVLLSVEYYKACGYDEIHPLPTEKEIAAALAANEAAEKSEASSDTQ